MAPKTPEELISALVDDDLDTEEGARAEQLMAEHPELRAQYDELRALRASFQSLPRHTAPATLRASVLERIEALRRSEGVASAGAAGASPAEGLSDRIASDRGAPEQPGPSPATLRFPRGFRPWLWPAAALAAAVLIMVVNREPKPQAELADTRHDERAARSANRDGRIGAASKAAPATRFRTARDIGRSEDKEKWNAPAAGEPESPPSDAEEMAESNRFLKKGAADLKGESADRTIDAPDGGRPRAEAPGRARRSGEAPAVARRPSDESGVSRGGAPAPVEPGVARGRAEPDFESKTALGKAARSAPLNATDRAPRTAKEDSILRDKAAAKGRGGLDGGGLGGGGGGSNRSTDSFGQPLRKNGDLGEQVEGRELSKNAATRGRRASGLAAQYLVVNCDITETAVNNEALTAILSKRNIAYGRRLRESLDNITQSPESGQKRGPSHVDFYFEASPQQVKDALSDIRDNVTEFPVVDVKAAPDVPQQQYFLQFSRGNEGSNDGVSRGLLPQEAKAHAKSAGPVDTPEPVDTLEIDAAAAARRDGAQDSLPFQKALPGTGGAAGTAATAGKIAKKEKGNAKVAEGKARPPVQSAEQPALNGSQPPPESLIPPVDHSSPAPLAQTSPAPPAAPAAAPPSLKPSAKPGTDLGFVAGEKNGRQKSEVEMLNAQPKDEVQDLLAGSAQKGQQEANKLRVLLRLRLADPRQQIYRKKG